MDWEETYSVLKICIFIVKESKNLCIIYLHYEQCDMDPLRWCWTMQNDIYKKRISYTVVIQLEPSVSIPIETLTQKKVL